MPTETDIGCRAAFPRETRHSKLLSEIHNESSHDEVPTLKELDLPEIPYPRPKTETNVDPETGATPGEIEDEKGWEKDTSAVIEPFTRAVVIKS